MRTEGYKKIKMRQFHILPHFETILVKALTVIIEQRIF